MERIFEKLDGNIIREYYTKRKYLLDIEQEVQMKIKFISSMKLHENKDDMSSDSYKIFELNHELNKKFLEVDQTKLKIERLMFHKFCSEHGLA